MFNRKPLLTLARHIALTCVSPARRKGKSGRCPAPGRPITNLVLCTLLFLWASRAYAQTTDTITFNDGEQLAGKLISVLGGTVTFHSEILGNVTVPLEKVKTLTTTHPFAVVEKNQHVTRKTAVEQIPVGSIALQNSSVSISPPHAEEKTFPASRIASLVDDATFHREIQSESDFFYGWAGSITLGASLVDATNSAQTYTGSVALTRSIPTIAWLPPASKTTLNLSGTYGLAKNPEILSDGEIFQAASTSKTNILHGDTEWDKYLSTVIFGLVNASADHNFGNGLQLQQAYGAGLGWSIIKEPKEDFDIKATLLYQQQQFYNGVESGLGTPSINLIGADLNETWSRTYAHNVKFNEYITLTPTFNVVRAYSAVGNANFVFPAYKKLNFTLSSTDNYLGDPPEGFRRNSFQFTAGITYVVK